MVTTQLLTAKDLWNLGDSAGDFELVKGELVPVVPPGLEHGVVQTRIGSILSRYVEERDLGLVASDVGVMVERDPETVVAPDNLFISKARLPDDQIGYLGIVPDLVIEVISPTNSPGEMERKLALYLLAGVTQVWIVYPHHRQVAVYRSGNDLQLFTVGQEIDCSPELPGLIVPVAAIFDGPRAVSSR
jgi:Uma2 family endonuclease